MPPAPAPCCADWGGGRPDCEGFALVADPGRAPARDGLGPPAPLASLNGFRSSAPDGAAPGCEDWAPKAWPACDWYEAAPRPNVSCMLPKPLPPPPPPPSACWLPDWAEVARAYSPRPPAAPAAPAPALARAESRCSDDWPKPEP